MKVIVIIADDDILLCGRTDADVKWIASKFEEKHKITYTTWVLFCR